MNQHPLTSNFDELYMLMAVQHDNFNLTAKLLLTDSMKYVSKAVRDELAHKLLNKMSDIEDATRAIVKAVRTTKRQRLTNDAQISNLFMNIADITAVTPRDYDRRVGGHHATYPNVAELMNNNPEQLRALLLAAEKGEETAPQ